MSYAVTIGIPVYNAEKYIRMTVDSAMAQTFESIEFLILDDCGTDSSIDIIREIQQTHPRGKDIRMLKNYGNMGVSYSRNRIVEEAQGKYLFFLDADDVISPDAIQCLYQEATDYGADVVYGSYEKINQLRGNSKSAFQYSYQTFGAEEEFANFFYQHYGHFQTTIWNCLMKVEMLRASKLRFIDASYWEDMAFTYEMVTKVRRVVVLPALTYHYYCHPYSLSSYHDREQLSSEEIMRNISTIDYLKWKCHKLRGRSYLPYMCYNLEMNSFYIICHVLKYYDRIIPPISYKDLKFSMKCPLELRDILQFQTKKIENILLWAISLLPLPLFVLVIKLLGRMKKVI